MLLLLTNASPEHIGNPIAINTDQILSVYRATGVQEDGTIQEVTNIFCPPHGVWNVLETPGEVVALFNGEKIEPKVAPVAPTIAPTKVIKSKSPRSIKKSEE